MNIDYPELYYKVYPKILSTVNEYLDENYSIEEITEEDMNEMVDRIYIKLVEEYPEIHEDHYERRLRGRKVRGEQWTFYGRSRIIRDLITIFLISELLRRRRSFYPI